MPPRPYELDDEEYETGSAGRSFTDDSIVYDPEAGTWSISRAGAVGPDYGLTGSRQLTTAMTPQEVQNRLGFEDPETQMSRSPDWWGDVPDLPQSDRFEFEGEAPTGAPEFEKAPREPDLRGIPPEEGITREPAEQDWFMHNLLKHMKLGGDPEKFEFGESYPTSGEIIQAEQTLSAETYETKDEAIKALRLQETGKWGPKEAAAQHGWRRAYPEYGTLEAEDVGAVQDPSTGLWKKEATPEAQAVTAREQALDEAERFEFGTDRPSDQIRTAQLEIAKEKEAEASRFEFGTSEEILKKANAGKELDPEEVKILVATSEQELAGTVPLQTPQVEAAPPRRLDAAEGLFISGVDIKTLKGRTYKVIGANNEPAAFALYDMQTFSRNAEELKKWGGISATSFNRTIEEQLANHPDWSRERAARGKHVLGLAVDIDTHTLGKESNEFQWMQENAFKFCYFWPAVKDDDGAVEYHHWEHDCAAAKRQAKAWGHDETLTGTLATTQDKHKSGEFTAEANKLLTGRQLTPGEARLAKRGEEYGGLVDVESETVEGLRRPISEKGAMKFSTEQGFGEKVKQADLMFPGAPGTEFEPLSKWTGMAPEPLFEEGEPSTELGPMFPAEEEKLAKKVAKEMGIDFSLLAQKPGSAGPGQKPWTSMLPPGTVFSPSLNKPIRINTSMSEGDIQELIEGEKASIAKLWPNDKFKQLDATQEFIRQVNSVFSQRAGEFQTEGKRLFELRQQIDTENEHIRTQIADQKLKQAKAEAMSAQAVQQTHEDVANAKEQKLAVMTREIEDLGKKLQNMEPEQFRIFGFTDADGFSFSKTLFTITSVPLFIANFAATAISGMNKRGKTIPFVMWDIISTSITNDMQAQRDSINNEMKEFNLKRTSYGNWLSYFKDAPLAAQKAHLDLTKAGLAKLKEMEQKEKDPLIRHYIKETNAYGMQKYRDEEMKFMQMLSKHAEGYSEHQKKLISHEQVAKKRFLDTQFFVMSKMNEDNAANKKPEDLSAPLQRIYHTARSFLVPGPKGSHIERMKYLWKKHGRNVAGSKVAKLVASMDPKTTLAKTLKLYPNIMDGLTMTERGTFEGLLELQHMRHTLAAGLSKMSGNVGNDNMIEQMNAMWNIPLGETFQRGWDIILRFEAQAKMFGSLKFYFQKGFQKTKQDYVDEGGKTGDYKGSAGYNMLLKYMADNPDDIQGQTAAINAFNGDINPQSQQVGTTYAKSTETSTSPAVSPSTGLGEGTKVDW